MVTLSLNSSNEQHTVIIPPSISEEPFSAHCEESHLLWSWDILIYSCDADTELARHVLYSLLFLIQCYLFGHTHNTTLTKNTQLTGTKCK